MDDHNLPSTGSPAWCDVCGETRVEPERHVLVGDLHYLEYAIADYIAKWGEHLTGRPYMGEFGPAIAGMPTSVANMAMTVIRKNLEPPRG